MDKDRQPIHIGQEQRHDFYIHYIHIDTLTSRMILSFGQMVTLTVLAQYMILRTEGYH